jgi:hypothetical protein
VIGYGKDQWCADRLVTGRYASGALLVAQACYRRLITPAGMLRWGEEESRYGFDVAGYVGVVGEDAAMLSLPAMVAAELSKDDRVADVLCTVTQSMDRGGLITLTLSIDVALQDSGKSFNLTMTVAEARAKLVSIREAA